MKIFLILITLLLASTTGVALSFEMDPRFLCAVSLVTGYAFATCLVVLVGGGLKAEHMKRLENIERHMNNLHG